MKDSSFSQPAFVIKTPNWALPVVLFVLIAFGIMAYPIITSPETGLDWSEHRTYRRTWVTLILLIILVPVIFRSRFFSVVISARGITRERWRGFDRPAKVVKRLAWSDVERVTAIENRSRGAGFKTGGATFTFEGFNDGELVSFSMRISNWTYQSYMARAIRYALEKTPAEVMDESVQAYLNQVQM